MSITIYTTPTCRFCVEAKEFFGEHNLAYEEKDVSVDTEARMMMIQKSGQLGVPVIDVDGKIVVGFNRDRLLELTS